MDLLATENQADTLKRQLATARHAPTRLRLLVQLSSGVLRTDPAAALDYAQQALEVNRQTGDDRNQIIVLNNIGQVYNTCGDYQKGFLYTWEAVEICARHPDWHLESARCCLNMGDAYYRFQEHDKALDYFQMAAGHALTARDFETATNAATNSGKILYDQHKFHQAAEQFKAALKTATGHGLHRQATLLHLHLCMVCLAQEKALPALRHAEKSIALAHRLNDAGSLAISLKDKGVVLLALKREAQAAAALHESLDLAGRHQMADLQADVHILLSRDAEQNADHQTALHHYRQYNQLRQEIFRKEHQAQVEQTKLRLETDQAVRQREDYKRKTRELEREIESKRGELSAMALAMAQKNQMLEELELRLRQADTTPSQSLKSVISQINTMRSGPDQWSQLQRQFESIDENFRRNLLEHVPAASPVEIKVAMLMRLQLSTKDIASLLCTSARTVETHRYQLRKKINLKGDLSLSTYLSRL